MGLIASQEVIAVEAVSYVCRDSPSRLAEPLSEEKETACTPVIVPALIEIGTIIQRSGLRTGTQLFTGLEMRSFIEVALSEIELRLKDDRSVFRELMLQTGSESVTL